MSTQANGDDRATRPTTNESTRLSVLTSDATGWSRTPSLSSEEDYDLLTVDPSAVIEGGHGGGIAKDGSITNLPATRKSHSARASFDEGRAYESIKPSSSSPGDPKPEARRRQSIHVILEHTSRKGRYVLTADDPEIREILRRNIEQEAEELDAKRKQKKKGFRDLVFTRQFTTFDRQNPTGSESPFHGFFTLFWLAMALLLVRIAAQNWRQYGSVFGGAELLRMMFDREAIVMGVTDGVMTVATVVSFFLQKAISKGYLTWNGSGWIIQNVWQTAYLGLFIGFTFYRQWPWTHTIFIVLHSLVYLMKQHSYAFYNGYCEF
jgi:sterol O-acyltransferase